MSEHPMKRSEKAKAGPKPNCVFVHEVAVLKVKGNAISHWEVWDTFNTYQEAVSSFRVALNHRPSWVSEKFHKQTNRIRKYVPAWESGQRQRKGKRNV